MMQNHHLHHNANGKLIIDKYIDLNSTNPYLVNSRGEGRRNPIGWNNQVLYNPIKGKNQAPSDSIMDPVSGKRNHWLSENGSTLPITSSHNSATKRVTGDNHDKCSHAGVGGGTKDCNATNRKHFNHHHSQAKNAKGIGYPGIKVPSAESTKKIYGSENLPFK